MDPDSVARSDFEALLDESTQKLEEFDQLGFHSPNNPDSIRFEQGMQAWFEACVAAGRFLPPGSAERRALKGLLDEWNSRLRRHDYRLSGPSRLADFDPKAGVVLDIECPYPGLDAYRANNREIFFGREAIAREYAQRLEDGHIFLIVGASGSGKSSLALAGIQPLLQRKHRDWLYCEPITPGTTPLATLAGALAQVGGRPEAAASLAERLHASPATAAPSVQALCDGRPLMLLVDQFEELFTLCRDASEQAAFAHTLLALANHAAEDWACRILITLRTDHLARFDTTDALRPLYQALVDERRYEHLPSLGFNDIRRAIVEPAQAKRLRFIPADIPDRLASETAGLANGLPLLQFALRRLWDTRPRNAEGRPLDLITDPMVKALPDVQRALGTVAEAIFREFTPRQQAICLRAVQELVVLDENFEAPLRRRRDRAQLMDVLRERFGGAEEDIATVESRFLAAGLLRRFNTGPQAQIEVTHEALLRHWDRVYELVSGEEVKRRLHAVKQIAREAQDWKTQSENEDCLKQQGQPLAAALDYMADGWLADPESRAYLAACRRREEHARLLTQQLQQQRELAQQAQAERFQAEAASMRRKVFANWVTALCVLLAAVVLGTVAAVQTRNQRQNASLETAASLSERLPGWEALDLTYTLALQGGSGFRFALAHALERMEDTRPVGLRDASLHLTGDGTALLQFDREQGELHVYLIGRDGKPSQQAQVLALGKDKLNRLIQAQIGPAIDQRPGRHWALLAYARPGTSASGFELESYLLGQQAGKALPTDISWDAAPQIGRFQNVSAIRIHSSGRRALFVGTDYQRLDSQIFQIRLDTSTDTARAEGLGDPLSATGSCPTENRDCLERRTVTAVAYGYGYGHVDDRPGSLITGRMNGEVYCGPDLAVDPAIQNSWLTGSGPSSTATDSSPVHTIASNDKSWPFASASTAGTVWVAICPKDMHKKPLDIARRATFSADPASLRLTTLENLNKTKERELLTYFDSGKQLRCYNREPGGENKWTWYVCNAAHPLSTAVVLSSGMQLTVEHSGVNLIRRYPSEGLFASQERSNMARKSGPTTLRWAVEDDADANKVTERIGRYLKPAKNNDIPWTKPDTEGVRNGDNSRLISFATLSADGRRIAWIEVRSAQEHLDLLTRSENIFHQETVRLIRTMNLDADQKADMPKQPGRALAVAINTQGRIAHVQAPSSPIENSVLYLDDEELTKIPSLDGVPSCIEFSPNGQYLVLGTNGGALRPFEIQASNVTPVSLKSSPPDGYADKSSIPRQSVPVTACAIADDGTLAAGYGDGEVRVFQRSGKQEEIRLTARTVYRFTVPIKQVTISGRHRVAALGEWQINGCTSAGLPGQTLRVWEPAQGGELQTMPISSACFPNTVIAALGEWREESRQEDTESCDSGTTPASAAARRIGICLIGATSSRWHECPGCTSEHPTAESIRDGLLKAAESKGARAVNHAELKLRYGLQLD